MLLSARLLQDVNSVNSFRPAQAAILTEGDACSVYFQLVDMSVDRAIEGFNPPGRRYVPAASATLMVTVDSLNLAKQLVRAATQPFAQDPSIWLLSIMATDKVRGSAPLKLTLTEVVSNVTRITTGQLQNAILTSAGN